VERSDLDSGAKFSVSNATTGLLREFSMLLRKIELTSLMRKEEKG
jgi:hypothetical protein